MHTQTGSPLTQRWMWGARGWRKTRLVSLAQEGKGWALVPTMDGPAQDDGKGGRTHGLNSAHSLCSQKYPGLQSSPYSWFSSGFSSGPSPLILLGAVWWGWGSPQRLGSSSPPPSGPVGLSPAASVQTKEFRKGSEKNSWKPHLPRGSEDAITVSCQWLRAQDAPPASGEKRAFWSRNKEENTHMTVISQGLQFEGKVKKPTHTIFQKVPHQLMHHFPHP